MSTARTLPVDIIQRYRPVFWYQFWNHRQTTPTHLWDGTGDRYSHRKPAKALCGKVIDGDSCHEVEADRASHLCAACTRIARKREAQ